MDKDNMKAAVGELITLILDNEEYLSSFVFFLNRLENTRIPMSEIKLVLNDYLTICEKKRIDGKNRVKDIGDRYLLKCEKNIGFMDITKIELISNAVINNTGVELPIDIHDFKRRYKNKILRNDEWGKTYKELMQMYQEGDEILETVSSRGTWKQLCGSSFVVLKRNGELVTAIIKSMN